MIVGDLKPIEEIAESISPYRNVLILGCASCVTVCLSGGDREAEMLALEISHPKYYKGNAPDFRTDTILRQCETDLVKAYQSIPSGTDAILSLACGAGVQIMADVFEDLPVLAGLNTTFMGASSLPGIWQEMCRGCGECVLSLTGGICPVSRCAKSLFNGPCGGTQGERCEIRTETPCAWILIYNRLKKQGKLHLMEEVKRHRDWIAGGAGGPRIRQRTGIAGSAGDLK